MPPPQFGRIHVAHGTRDRRTSATGERMTKPSTDKAKQEVARPGGVVLLAGGNPQIPKGHGDAPVQAYISAMPGWKQALGRRLDTLVTESVPGITKAVKWNSPFYGIEGQGWFLSFRCFTKYVKVTFFRGAALAPLPPGPSKHENVRYLDIREGELDEEQFVDWVLRASRLPGAHI
jgi:hypothetical protein